MISSKWLTVTSANANLQTAACQRNTETQLTARLKPSLCVDCSGLGHFIGLITQCFQRKAADSACVCVGCWRCFITNCSTVKIIDSPSLHLRGTQQQQQECSADEMTSYSEPKIFLSLHPGSAGGKTFFTACFCLFACFVKKNKNRTTKLKCPPPRSCFFFVVVAPSPCIRHRCVNYWKSVFFPRLLCGIGYKSWLQLDSSSYFNKKKKFQTLGGPGNQQIDVGSGQWRSY